MVKSWTRCTALSRSQPSKSFVTATSSGLDEGDGESSFTYRDLDLLVGEDESGERSGVVGHCDNRAK